MNKLSFILSLFFFGYLHSQNGPGGFGTTDGSSDVVLWLDTNKLPLTSGSNVTTWIDESGYGNNATASTGNEPVFITNVLNSYPTIRFTAANLDFLSVTDDSSLNPAELSYYIVFNYTASTSGYSPIIIKSSNYDWDDGYGFVKNDFDDEFSAFIDDWLSESNIINLSSNTNYIIHSGYDQNRLLLSENGDGDNQNVINSYISSSNDLLIGISPDNRITPNTFIDPLDGDIAEIIIVNERSRRAVRNIISNYLSAKYNIPLDGGINGRDTYDYYTMDDSVNGDFDHKVAGIGRQGGGINNRVTESRGTGIVTISNPSSLNNGDYLFWGEDIKDASYTFSTQPDYRERMDTKWRVSETNEIGTVTVTFDLSAIDLSNKQACTDLNLVLSNDNFASERRVFPLTISGSNAIATGVNFNNEDYFTLEYIDKIVLDGTTFYNGSGTGNAPNTSDSCYKLLVTSTTTGATAITENAHVREVEVETGGNLAITNDNYLEIDNGLELNGDIRLVGNAQIIQNHTGASQVTGSGKLYIDQKSNINTTNSVYRYTYWSSPVVENSGDTSYAVGDVMKDGSTATTATGSSSEAQNINWLTYGGTLANLNGDPTPPISIANYWIYTYKEGIDNSGFSQQLNTGSIPVGQGYLMKGSGNASGQNFTFSGIPNDGVINIPISTSETNTIIGNPYPSAINANQFMDDNAGVIKQELYFWQHQGETSAATITEGHTQSGYIGGYTVLNRTMGVGATQPSLNSGGIGGSTYDPPGAYIPVGQGFLVTAENTGNIVFQNSQREYQALRGDGGDSFFFGSPPPQENTETEYPKLRIGFEHTNQYNVELHRQIGVGFIDGLSFNYESGYDSRIYDTRFTDIYWKFPNDDNSYIITGVQPFEKNLQIPLEVRIQENQPVKFMIDSKENFPSGTEIFLKDTANDEFYNLSNTIELNLAEGIYTDRFFITFSSNSSLSNEDVLSNNVNIYFKKLTQELVITTQNNITFKNVKLYDILGKEIKNWQNLTTQNKTLKLPISKLATAIYLVSIETQEGIVAKKIIL